MKRVIGSDVGRASAALLVLLAIQAAQAADWPGGAAGVWRRELASTLSNRGLNKEAREALTAGYYEGLLNEGSRLSTMNRFVIDDRRPGWEENKRPDRRQTNDFLYYEHIPSGVFPDYEDARFKYHLTTNSAGLGDKEYSLEKPPRTRRIALLGDSITRGLGAPQDQDFETLLEQKLNEAHATDRVAHYEILNFSVGGYHITQQMESAKVKAAPYKPDVYIVALTDLSVYRRWHGHISTLTYSGMDLKYDYLRNMVREARLTANDPIGVWDARLARYRIPTIRWVLTEMQKHAQTENARLMAILVPSTESPEVLAEAFLGVPEVIDELGIPAVNLLGTFAGGQDLERFRVSEGDRHPNEEGHRLLFDRLYANLLSDPDLMALFTGSPRELRGATTQ